LFPLFHDYIPAYVAFFFEHFFCFVFIFASELCDVISLVGLLLLSAILSHVDAAKSHIGHFNILPGIPYQQQHD
jgi:hypothetical protein